MMREKNFWIIYNQLIIISKRLFKNMKKSNKIWWIKCESFVLNFSNYIMYILILNFLNIFNRNKLKFDILIFTTKKIKQIRQNQYNWQNNSILSFIHDYLFFYGKNLFLLYAKK